MYALGEEHSPTLYHALGGRISPVVQPEDEDTQKPYCWYVSDSMNEASTKDGRYSDTCTVQIEVVANTYRHLLSLLAMVRSAMDSAPDAWEAQEQVPFHIAEQTFSAGPEEYDDQQQAYCRKLNYIIETYGTN